MLSFFRAMPGTNRQLLARAQDRETMDEREEEGEEEVVENYSFQQKTEGQGDVSFFK
jgi:hypothetical protein